MKTIIPRIAALLPLAASLCLTSLGHAAEEPAPPIADPGWPREHVSENKKLIVYQPQIDEWKDHSTIHFRCAIEVEGVLKEPTFGVAEIEARTLVDQETRTVKVFTTQRTYRFVGVSGEDEKALLAAMDVLSPPERLITVSLDRVLTCLDADSAAVQKQVDVNLDPPKIFYSEKPAVLVIFLGEPQFKPVAAEEPDLMFALNTNWDVFYEPSTKNLFLLNEDHWLTSTSPEGPWTVASELPARLSKLPADDNWEEVRKHIPAKKSEVAEHVFASKEPAELLLTAGEPEYQPIPQTKLLEITNTESLLMLDSAGGKFYFQAAGRWFRSAKLEGPWSAASSDLPEDFTKIPDDHPLAFVKATVPGTDEAADAVLLASVPQSTYVDSTKPPTLEVTYKGEPDFQPIPSTTVKVAVNSPFSVFNVDNGYHCCDQGVWFSAKTATGPWEWSTSVPDAIYTIPPTSPAHNVTYVTAYNPASGVYSRGACAYGPRGSAGYRAAYNPYTGGYAARGYRATPYGTATAGRAYNPYTGTSAAGGRVSNAYGSAGRAAAYNPYTGRGAVAGGVSGARGSAAGIRTSEGTGVAAWDTRRGQGAVAKTKNDNIYAAHNGNVYKKDSDGNWSSNTGNGGRWESASDRPQPRTNDQTRQPGDRQATNQPQRPSAQPQRPATRPQPTAQPQRPTTRPQPTTQPQRPDYFRQAGIVIDVIDSRTNKLVFRGFAKSDVVKSATPSTRRARIDAAVTEALTPFFK